MESMMNDKMNKTMSNGCKNQRYMETKEMKEMPKMKDDKKMDEKEMPKKWANQQEADTIR